MTDIKFDPKKLHKLNNPERLKDISPEYIQSKLHLKQSDIIIEIGAGTAFFCKAFHDLLKPSVIYACDVSDIMIQWINENVTQEYPDVIPVKSMESSIPLESNLANLVYMINLHHELEHPDLIINESFRLLKPGGKIFIADWLKKEMNEGPPLGIRHLPENVKNQLENAGFDSVHISGGLPKHFLVVGKKHSDF